MKNQTLNAQTVIWNLIFIKGGESKLKSKFIRDLKKDGYSKSNFLGCYMRWNNNIESANSRLHELKGVHSTLLQITDEQFGKMQISY